ncbi:MAG: hypothetical protein ABIT83_20835 [Massilia sp.]
MQIATVLAAHSARVLTAMPGGSRVAALVERFLLISITGAGLITAASLCRIPIIRILRHGHLLVNQCRAGALPVGEEYATPLTSGSP